MELVRARQLPEAIAYAKKWLTLWSDTHLKEIQQAMALLVFRPESCCGVYKACRSSWQDLMLKVLFDASRWDRLVGEFKRNMYDLHNLTSQSLLEMTLQVGL